MVRGDDPSPRPTPGGPEVSPAFLAPTERIARACRSWHRCEAQGRGDAGGAVVDGVQKDPGPDRAGSAKQGGAEYADHDRNGQDHAHAVHAPALAGRRSSSRWKFHAHDRPAAEGVEDGRASAMMVHHLLDEA